MNQMADNSAKSHKEGVALFRAGKYAEALEKFEAALQGTTDPKQMAEIYNDMGVAHRELEDYPAAYLALNEAMSRFTEMGDEKGQAQTLGNRAAVYESEGLIEEAVETYKQSAAIFEEIGQSEMAMYVWQAASRLRMKQGQYVAAIGAYEEGVDNMPKGSLKGKILRQILKVPGSMLGGGGNPAETDDEE
jgi:tetratricopeptide (TPR) repeat protein